MMRSVFFTSIFLGLEDVDFREGKNARKDQVQTPMAKEVPIFKDSIGLIFMALPVASAAVWILFSFAQAKEGPRKPGSKTRLVFGRIF